MAKFDVKAAVASVKVNTEGSGKAYLKEMLDTSNRTVKNIPLDLIDNFNGHPFSVNDDTDMELLVDSIKQNGVITPVELREKEGGRYELISGHRRRRACQLAEIFEIPAIIEDLTDEEAIIRMVDANLQREKILPSERAFAYKMKLEALKKKGGNEGCKLRDLIGDGESGRTVQRYLALIRLIPEMLELVDKGKMPVTIGATLSSMPKECQEALIPFIKVKMPNAYMAIELRDLPRFNIFNEENIKRILYEMPKRAPSTPKRENDEDIKARLTNILTKYEKESGTPEIEQKDIFENYVSVDTMSTEKKKSKKVDTMSTEKISNFNGTDNQVMKGYILKAIDMWNIDYPSAAFSKETIDNLLTALHWATDELTAEEAYHYYEKKR